MRRLLLVLLLTLAPAWAQTAPEPPRPAEHVVLLDASGSMIKGGYATAEGWSERVQGWLAAVLRPDGRFFRDDDTVVFQRFSFEDRQAAHEAGRRGPLPLSQAAEALKALPGPEPDGATDLEYGLKLAGARQGAARFVWLLTDNANNIRGKTSDADFYRSLRDDPAWDYVFFFPLAEAAEPGAAGTESAGSLVLYLLVDAEEPAAPWIGEFVKAVDERLGFGGILFRPLYADPDRPVLRVGHRLEVRGPGGDWRPALRTGGAGNPIEIPLQREGRDLAAHLRFHLESRMDGWEIRGAKLQRPRVGDLQADLRPLTLTVKPGSESQDQYEMDLRMPRPAQPKPMEGVLELNAVVNLGKREELVPSVSDEVDARMKAVHGLPEILDFMLHQGGDAAEETRVIAVREPILLRPVQGGWGLLPWAIGGLALLLAAAAALLLAGRAYRLSGPDGERTVRLGGMFRRVDLESRDGEVLGSLRPAGRDLEVRPEPEVRVDGQEEPLRLDLDRGEVQFGLLGPRGQVGAWSVQRGGGGGRSGGDEEGLSL